MSENELATKKDLTDLKEELLGRMQLLATKEELDQKIATLVTKEEFDQKIATLATKEELDQKIATLATKEELDQKIATLATKEALEVVARQGAINTRDISEMKGDIKVLKWEMGQMREEIKSLETKFDKKFDVLITAVDGIAKELMDMRTEKVATEHVLNRHETKLENHDKRIRKLELKKAS